MHQPDTHTHAHIHTHQRQWAVKRCPYPPQKASTNQIRPDQNMPFKVRDGVKGGIQGSTADTLTLGAISMTRERERRVEGGEAGWNKNGGNAKVPSSLGLEMRVGVFWGPTQHQARVLPTSSASALRLFTQDTGTPLMPLYTSAAWTLGPGLPLRKPRPHLCVFFILVLIITCISNLILWVTGFQKVNVIKCTMCVGSFTCWSLLIELTWTDSYTRGHIYLHKAIPAGIWSQIQRILLNYCTFLFQLLWLFYQSSQ